MKIQLKNFRCHKSATFELPDQGLVLLAGQSGSGKSSILKAIFYALFGSKAVKKPYTFGTTTCSVTLEAFGMHIIRTNRPNRLVVNDKLEDAPAQEFIYQKLGMGFDEFLVSSYLPQKNNSSILSLPQLQQIEIIKGLAFDNSDIGDLKTRLKKMIRDANTEVTTQISKVDVYEQQVEKTAEQCEELMMEVFPLPTVGYDPMTDSDAGAIIQDFFTRIETSGQKLAGLYRDLEKIRERDKILDELAELRSTEGLDTLEKLVEWHNYTVTARSIADTLKELETLIAEESAAKTAEIDKLRLELWQKWSLEKSESRLAEMESFMQQAKKWILSEIPDPSLLKKYTAELADLESAVAALDLLECPECGEKLRMKGGKLLAANVASDIAKCDLNKGELQEKIAETKRKIRVLEGIDWNSIALFDISEKATLPDKIIRTKQYITKNKAAEMRLADLTDTATGDSPAVKSLKRKLERERAKLGTGEPPVPEPEWVAMTDSEIQQKIAKIRMVLDKIAKLTRKVTDHEAIANTDTDTVKQAIANVEAQQTADLAIRSNVEQWVAWQKVKAEQAKWISQLNAASDLLGESEEKYSALLKLKDYFTKAEILAVETTVENINEWTQNYLDLFFVDNPLAATLNFAVKGKAQQLKIDTHIEYKGNDYDNISQLSGGEFDRCTLASVCGINSMLNSPILILDESLSALDSDNNTEILHLLKGLAEDKMILVCSHEAVRGIFDEVITLTL